MPPKRDGTQKRDHRWVAASCGAVRAYLPPRHALIYGGARKTAIAELTDGTFRVCSANMDYRLTCALALSACVAGPTTVPPTRAPTPVVAPFARTWSAVIDVFAERSIALRTLDRSSGFAATEEFAARGEIALADCGSDVFNRHIGPLHASWNIRVKGDSMRSSVLITARWWIFRDNGAMRIDCVTTGAWERGAEQAIRTRAEQGESR